jgi:hypothetical protein
MVELYPKGLEYALQDDIVLIFVCWILLQLMLFDQTELALAFLAPLTSDQNCLGILTLLVWIIKFSLADLAFVICQILLFLFILIEHLELKPIYIGCWFRVLIEPAICAFRLIAFELGTIWQLAFG